jgi:hypothetical protein
LCATSSSAAASCTGSAHAACTAGHKSVQALCTKCIPGPWGPCGFHVYALCWGVCGASWAINPWLPCCVVAGWHCLRHFPLVMCFLLHLDISVCVCAHARVQLATARVELGTLRCEVAQMVALKEATDKDFGRVSAELAGVRCSAAQPCRGRHRAVQ